MSVIEIKEAALELFATHGYENTTIRDIGSAVGIKGSSIYSHFQSKEEIFSQVVSDLIKKMIWENINIDAIKNSKTEIQLKPLLFSVFKSYYNFFAEHKFELLLWQRIRFFPPMKLKEIDEINKLLYGRPVLEVYIELFTYGVEHKQLRNSDIGMMVLYFFSLVSGYTDSLIIVPFRLSDQQIQEGFDIFWDGIRDRT